MNFSRLRRQPGAEQATWPTGSGDRPLLTCRGVDVAYDKVQVLFGVDLDVQAGEIVALLGTNGAGKSTMLKAISGLVHPIAGRIEPRSGWLRPEMARSSVDLPAPLVPSSARTSPSWTSTLTSKSTWSEP